MTSGVLAVQVGKHVMLGKGEPPTLAHPLQPWLPKRIDTHDQITPIGVLGLDIQQVQAMYN
jgi:hypothetical protein